MAIIFRPLATSLTCASQIFCAPLSTLTLSPYKLIIIIKSSFLLLVILIPCGTNRYGMCACFCICICFLYLYLLFWPSGTQHRQELMFGWYFYYTYDSMIFFHHLQPAWHGVKSYESDPLESRWPSQKIMISSPSVRVESDRASDPLEKVESRRPPPLPRFEVQGRRLPIS